MEGQQKYQRMDSRTVFHKMQEPPQSVEEFLKFQNWDYWPREVNCTDNDKWSGILKAIKEDSSFISIYTHLWKNVPRIYEATSIMESRLNECSLLLQNHASKIYEWKRVIFETSSRRQLERYREFLKKFHKEKKIM
ncbi:protein FAM227B-like, partial [Carlito syrichta]|uniref:Protein FAM227B-like n=1 Tax=Carlito syrichta TaxID=1868482 RepID=A0A3Q0DR60_CARSF